jgi:hypothetical protein
VYRIKELEVHPRPKKGCTAIDNNNNNNNNNNSTRRNTTMALIIEAAVAYFN